MCGGLRIWICLIDMLITFSSLCYIPLEFRQVYFLAVCVYYGASQSYLLTTYHDPLRS